MKVMFMLEGYFESLHEKEYHASHAISSSTLTHALRSNAHFWANYVGNPNRVPQPETKALRYGRAIHKFLLEQNAFVNEYRAAPKLDKRTKEGKLAWAELTADAELNGFNIITADEADLITSMSNALRDFHIVDDNGRSIKVADIFSNGKAEESFFWRDADTGLMLRARTDWRIGDVIIDYKTTTDARPSVFCHEIAKRRYYMRAAMYMDGVEAVTGKRPKEFYFIAQEKTTPFCAATYRVNPDDLLYGQRQYKHALQGIKRCMDNNKWTGYSELVQTLSIPAYFYDDVQQG